MAGTAAKAEFWELLGYRSSRELLGHFPRRYEDRSRWDDPFICPLDQAVTVQGVVIKTAFTRWRGGRAVFEVRLLPDGHLQDISLMWFNMPYLKKVIQEEDRLILHGKVSEGKRGRCLMHPDFEILKNGEEPNIHLNRITPIYPTVSGVHQRTIRAALYRLLFEEPLKIREFYEAPETLLPRQEAIRQIHFPESFDHLAPARKRLAFDELLILQVIMGVRRQKHVTFKKDRFARRDPLVGAYLGNLGFSLTGAQERVIKEIDRDLERPRPMHRLLQGDVGSGKTVVAAYALVRTLETGKTGVLLAPTETLAMQHAKTLETLLSPLDIEVVLWTRSSPPARPDSEKLRVIVGTHAVIQKSAVLDNLGLGVIDEQHKFGVNQRQALLEKGDHPDLLVMTATPIPRTLCLTYYGDLDVSVLDEMPPGRRPVKTVVRSRRQLPKVWDYIKKEFKEGRQAYVVYPLVEESEKLQARSVKEAYAELTDIFGENQVVLLHGRMDSAEKQAQMTRFQEGKVPVMVATSVIEVGVDNPNATIMVIENAERFGLAQLHQLRGRVGRGHDQSFCVLVSGKQEGESRARLQAMENTHDGFKIAEEDLKLRGPGDLLGREQSGFPHLKIAHLVRDSDLIEPTRRMAEVILEDDPALRHHSALLKRVRPYLADSAVGRVG